MRSLTRWCVVATALIALVGYSSPALALHNDAVVPANKCLAGKIKCVIKKKACILGLFKKSFNVDTVAIAKCMTKFEADPPIPGKGCFAKLEAKGNCLTQDDAGVIEAKVDAHVMDLIEEINPTGAGGTNKCSNGKVGCVLKYNSCILGLYGKKTKGGGAVSLLDATKCRDSLTKCFGKLEGKYGNVCDGGTEDGASCAPDFGQACITGGGTCVPPPSVTPCLTTGDLVPLRDKDDAFIDDIISELVVDPDMNTQRCSGNTSIKCLSAPNGGAGCGGPLGLCQFYFGAPLPLSACGVAVCVTNQWDGSMTGTFNHQNAQSSGTAKLLSTVYNGISVESPCPRCLADQYPNDAVFQGTCSGGPRNGLPCDVNGRSPEPTFNPTSMDCPPSGSIGVQTTIDLSNTTGVKTLTVTAASPICNGAPTKKCLCASCSGNSSVPCTNDAVCAAAAAGTCTNAAGEPRKPNACIDSTSTPIDESLCVATSPANEGECPVAPVTQKCAIQTFRCCTTNADCSAVSGDTCVAYKRECYPNYNGNIGDSITATGFATPIFFGYALQGFASVFCVAPTSSNAVNAVAGLPGPGRSRLAGIGRRIISAPNACADKAWFQPTFQGPSIDLGWTGITHDAKIILDGKVTVGVTGCSGSSPNCGICTYGGPIQNLTALP